ncbi:hypothetical protein ACROYT_G033321 [Oculina patagonica]
MFTTASLILKEASLESCMTPSGEIPQKARWPTTLLTMKGRTRIGTWNVRTLYEAGRATQVANEMCQYNIAVLAICESRWNGAADDQKEEFYSSLQGVLDHIPRRDIKILLGDLNAKIGPDDTGKERVMGCHGLGCMRENGERKWRSSLLDVRVKRGADIASDHHLLLGTFKVKLRAYCDPSARPHCKYNIPNLSCSETAKMFNCTVKNKFSALVFVDDDLNNHWAGLKKTWQESCDEVLGRRASNRKEWLSNKTWSLILQRKGVKKEGRVTERNGCPTKLGL